MARIVGRVLLFLIEFVFLVVVYGTPILGLWLTTSLAAFLNGPTWLPPTAGALAFPVLPLLWELWATIRHKRKKDPKPRILSAWHRITFRTLAINATLLCGLLLWSAETSFIALSTRGDWFLENEWVRENIPDRQVDLAREVLFTAADGVEWLYTWLNDNPFEDLVDERFAEEESIGDTGSTPGEDESASDSDAEETDEESEAGDGLVVWPWEEESLHPAAANVPAGRAATIQSVAEHIAALERDPFLRVKALHDFVVSHVSYDAEALAEGRYPPQDPETVFATGRGVCAGYANLLAAMGAAIGVEIVVVTGNSRDQNGGISGVGHAWNAAKIEGHWYLIDATWDDGPVEAQREGLGYTTDYLFPPPENMAVTHFPRDPRWQLLSPPLSRGEFLRQPFLRPRFFADGLTLVAPDRSQTEVSDTATIIVHNPEGRWILAGLHRKGVEESTRCETIPGSTASISCPLPTPGTYLVDLYTSETETGAYQFAGQLEFVRRVQGRGASGLP